MIFLANLTGRWMFFPTVNSLSIPARHFSKHRETRYFEYHLVAPPLSPSNNSSRLSQSFFQSSELPILYTNDPKRVSKWLCDHVPESGCSLGFDMESVPVVPWLKNKVAFVGPATIQLATSDAAMVVHLVRSNGRPSRACQPLLEAVFRDERIIKVGCSIDQDLVELRETCWHDIEARSRLDLGRLGLNGQKNVVIGLKSLTKEILGLELLKPKNVARSNWSKIPLSDIQIVYAARDAWVGAAVMAELQAYNAPTFNSEIIAEKLKSQQSIKELAQTKIDRKVTKMMLSALLAPYTLERKLGDSNFSELPSWKEELASELKMILHETKPKFDEFDITMLRYQTDTSNSTT